MYGIKLCVFTSVFLCCPGGKWQMSGSRVGLSAPLKLCCYIYTYTYLHIRVLKKERKKKNYERLSILKSPCSPYSQLGGQDINMLLHFPNIL